MFVLTMKLSQRRVLVGAAALLLAIGLGVTGTRLLVGRNTMTSAQGGASGEKTKKIKTTAKTNQDRITFAAAFGWEVDSEPAEVLEVIIPKEFDSVYTEYNSIQKQQGFNLEKFAGKRVKRYSYMVTNYPETEDEVRINLLVHNNKVIGGDVGSVDAGGFMHGFAMT